MESNRKSIKRKNKNKINKRKTRAVLPTEASECAGEGLLLGQANTRPMTPQYSASWAYPMFFCLYFSIYQLCLFFLNCKIITTTVENTLVFLILKFQTRYRFYIYAHNLIKFIFVINRIYFYIYLLNRNALYTKHILNMFSFKKCL